MALHIIAYKLTHANEKGVTAHVDDLGGLTFHGIAQTYHPNWEGWDYLDTYGALKFPGMGPVLWQLHEDFFEHEFWDPMRLTETESQPLANEVYDCGVLFGRDTAARFLQRALHVLSLRGSRWDTVKVDGRIGVRTLRAANTACRAGYTAKLISVIESLRVAHHVQRCIEDPRQQTFMSGWVARVLDDDMAGGVR